MSYISNLRINLTKQSVVCCTHQVSKINVVQVCIIPTIVPPLTFRQSSQPIGDPHDIAASDRLQKFLNMCLTLI
uniref:Putative ovule protein n=1 Tax=Solanum chacoense TaxID=4108 RepID=A0A0V0GKE9_SOLCH